VSNSLIPAGLQLDPGSSGQRPERGRSNAVSGLGTARSVSDSNSDSASITEAPSVPGPTSRPSEGSHSTRVKVEIINPFAAAIARDLVLLAHPFEDRSLVADGEEEEAVDAHGSAHPRLRRYGRSAGDTSELPAHRCAGRGEV
jgi:hypothetical protein